ncbi:MAG: AAA family ATPase [Mycolicibacterium sp.]|nr:AAA family ATPase [Mycolicibacterium sp.]
MSATIASVPATFETTTANPQFRETHTGLVALVGDLAYKIKKPVVTDFLDFRTVESREHVCAREVALNSRLAPDSYLGVAHLSGPGCGPPEPIIVMRRYPDSVRLSSMVARGEAVEHHVTAIADEMARFHARAERSRRIDVSATVGALGARWQENLIELRRYVGTVLSAEPLAEIERLAVQFISGRAELFAARIAERRIVDGHGDLLADDVFLPDGRPVLLDCLEFDDGLRYVDCIDDVAFLAMDLEFLGRRDLADFFLAEYRRLSGDLARNTLVQFYVAYRAVVRAKVDCIRSDQGQSAAQADARAHLDIAVTHLRAGTVRLILVGGGPGTGKTTLAQALAESMDAQVISTDDVRRELSDSGQIAGVIGIPSEGLYSRENVAPVYDAVLSRASVALACGQSVILDGTWRDPEQRGRARDLARQRACPVVELACTVPLREAQRRIAARVGTTSDATARIAEVVAADSDDWTGFHHIDTHGDLSVSVAEAQQICCLAI